LRCNITAVANQYQYNGKLHQACRKGGLRTSIDGFIFVDGLNLMDNGPQDGHFGNVGLQEFDPQSILISPYNDPADSTAFIQGGAEKRYFNFLSDRKGPLGFQIDAAEADIADDRLVR
jgi:hypothetical protein